MIIESGYGKGIGCTIVEARGETMDAEVGVFDEGWGLPGLGCWIEFAFDVAIDCLG